VPQESGHSSSRNLSERVIAWVTSHTNSSATSETKNRSPLFIHLLQLCNEERQKPPNGGLAEGIPAPSGGWAQHRVEWWVTVTRRITASLAINPKPESLCSSGLPIESGARRRTHV
jgi:hypothetical protein